METITKPSVPPPHTSSSSSTSTSNPLFQMHHPDNSFGPPSSSTQYPRPHPIRTMSSSAAQSPFFPNPNPSGSSPSSSSPLSIHPHHRGYPANHHPRSGSSASAMRESLGAAGGTAGSTTTSGVGGGGGRGASPDSMASSSASTSAAARFGIIGGFGAAGGGGGSGGGPSSPHSPGSVHSLVNNNNPNGSSSTANASSTATTRWGTSGLRNTLARGSMGAGMMGSGQGTSGAAAAWITGGTQTRSNSFSGRETRSPRLVDEMPSHVEESWMDRYKSSSSPFPTFSDTSSPPSSPPLPRAHLVDAGGIGAGAGGRPHSPPRAEANVSRSRSQSMAPGVLRPAGFGNGVFGGFGMQGFTGLGGVDLGGSRAGNNDSPWGDSGRVTNNNPLFSSTTSSNRKDYLESPRDFSPSRLGIAGEGRRFVHGQDTYSSSANEKYNNPTHDTLTSSVHAALMSGPSAPAVTAAAAAAGTGGGFDPYASSSAHARAFTAADDQVGLGHPGGYSSLLNGGQSGSSSRRHSISVASGPSARRGFQIPGFGFSEALVSPEIESKFPLHGSSELGSGQQMGSRYGQAFNGGGGGAGGGFGNRGRPQGGFSDDDLLSADLGSKLSALSVGGLGANASNIESSPRQAVSSGSFDERRSFLVGAKTRDSSTASIREEARSRFDGRPQDATGPGGASRINDVSNRAAPGAADWQQQQPSLPNMPTNPPFGMGMNGPGYASTFVPRSNMVPPGAQGLGQSFAPTNMGYGAFASAQTANNYMGPRQDAFGPGYNTFHPANAMQPGRVDYSQARQQQQQHHHQQQLQQQQQHNLYSQPAKVSPFAPGQPPSFVGSIGSGPAILTNQAMNDMGKGVPVQMLNPATRLFIVEFKAGRTDLFYTPDPTVPMQLGDLVIVEADRGQDLGKIKEDKITVEDVRAFNIARKQEMEINGPMSARIKGALINILQGEANAEAGANPNPAAKPVQREIMPKRIFGKAGPADQQLLTAKLQDEAQALALCQQRVKQKRLPMEVLDAEYQWDRRKLTFYFIAEKRIDFRELVRELFRIHKTRIWMASLDHSYLQEDDSK